MTLALIALAGGVLMVASGFKGRTISELLRGDIGSRANPITEFARIFDVDAFRERATVPATSSGGGGSTQLASLGTAKGSTAGGAKAIVDQAVRIGARRKLQVISRLRPGASTSSGNVSDHSENNARRSAADLSNTGNKGTSPEMDAAVEEIAEAFGTRVNGKRAVVKTWNRDGYRFQLLYRTQVGGDHDGHIHFGVRRTGGMV